MASFYKDGDRLNFEGFKGTVIAITETYRKNVIVLKVDSQPRNNPHSTVAVKTLGIFEYPDGRLQFMNIID